MARDNCVDACSFLLRPQARPFGCADIDLVLLVASRFVLCVVFAERMAASGVGLVLRLVLLCFWVLLVVLLDNWLGSGVCVPYTDVCVINYIYPAAA